MKTLKHRLKACVERIRLPPAAKAVLKRNELGPSAIDPGTTAVIQSGIAWLCRAQDRSAAADGGVARHYSLLDGWAPSYPETTGYIVATMLTLGQEMGRSDLTERGRRMLDWLVSIQFEEGGFQGGMVTQTPRVPVTFNTGQILIGLCAGAELDRRYLAPMRKAADWLANTQDADGCWRKHATPFAAQGEKTYETHVSIGLFRAAAIDPARGYLEAAVRQVDWALTNQHENGWLSKCCLGDPIHPLTHTLGYALRGIVEAYLSTGNQRYLGAACRTADGLMTALTADGKLPGRLDAAWQPAAEWICLTGLSQIAESWLLLYKATGRIDYRRAALLANAFVRRTISLDGTDDIRGGVQGSFPVDGEYGRFQYLNWACKFTIDANLAEQKLS